MCERTLRRYIAAGQIRHRRLPGGHYRIPLDAIEEFWSAQEPRGRTPPRSARRVPERTAAGVARRLALTTRGGEGYDISPGHLARLRAQLAAGDD